MRIPLQPRCNQHKRELPRLSEADDGSICSCWVKSTHAGQFIIFIYTYQFIIKAARFSMFCLCPFSHPPSNLPDAAPRQKYRPVEGLILCSRTGVIHSDISPTPPLLVTRGGSKSAKFGPNLDFEVVYWSANDVLPKFDFVQSPHLWETAGATMLPAPTKIWAGKMCWISVRAAAVHR